MEENENKNVVNPDPQGEEAVKQNAPQEIGKEEKKTAPKANGGEPPKKKKMSAGMGILIALVIVLCILIIALLLRMVIAGDGDYFKPFKDIFGIKTEEEKAPNVQEKKGLKSAERYTLLSDDVDDEDVSHYRVKVDVGDVVAKVVEAMKTTFDDEEGKTKNSNSSEVYDNTDDDDYFVTSTDDYDSDEDDEYLTDSSYTDSDEEDEDYITYSNTNTDYENDTDNEVISPNPATNIINSFADVAEVYKNYLDGEIYFDIYFDGNDLVQAVAGFDYAPIVDNLYDYLKDHPEETDGETFDTVDELADYLVDNFSEYLTEDALYDAIVSEDEDFESEMSKYGIKEKDIKDAIDIVNEKGLVEIYLNGTTKVKGLISMGLDSDEFQDWLDDVEDETGAKIDRDNIFESAIEAANDYIENSDDYKDYGIKFTEVTKNGKTEAKEEVKSKSRK